MVSQICAPGVSTFLATTEKHADKHCSVNCCNKQTLLYPFAVNELCCQGGWGIRVYFTLEYIATQAKHLFPTTLQRKGRMEPGRGKSWGLNVSEVMGPRGSFWGTPCTPATHSLIYAIYKLREAKPPAYSLRNGVKLAEVDAERVWGRWFRTTI